MSVTNGWRPGDAYDWNRADYDAVFAGPLAGALRAPRYVSSPVGRCDYCGRLTSIVGRCRGGRAFCGRCEYPAAVAAARARTARARPWV